MIICFATIFPSPVKSQQAEVSGQVAVIGSRLTRDGKPWIPHGFYQIAFEVPPGELAHQKPFWTVASRNFDPAEYKQMLEFGADSVRIQVAQTGMDPEGQYYTPQFRNRVVSAIRDARAVGLTVIVSVQDEPQTGEMHPVGLPSAATERIWRELAPEFGEDQGVLFEIFNEPNIGPQTDAPPSAADWQTWKSAMEDAIGLIRALGASNVVVADGLEFAEELSGAPQLDDPLHQVVYAAHPYALHPRDQRPSVWDTKFGDFARTSPVIISEWGIGYFCNADTAKAVVDLLAYLQERGIGLEIGAWDWASAGFGSAIYNFPSDRISSFQLSAGEQACHPVPGAIPYIPPGYGTGKLIQEWYRTGVPPKTIE